MATLAIKGHEKKGAEVIAILETLGGRNLHNYSAGCDSLCFYIGKGVKDTNVIYYDWIHNCYDEEDWIVFSLEEFLEKFPYKVGDKVYNIIHNENQTITDLAWDSQEYEIVYQTNNNEYLFVNYLQPYKEETMNRKYADLRIDVDQDDKLATEATIDGDKITPPNNYLIGKITKVDNGMLVEFVKKQPQYPKTYEECCKIMQVARPTIWFDYNDVSSISEEGDEYERHIENTLCSFRELLICRDAYWRIAGEQMGSGKPWEPELNSKKHKFALSNVGGNISFEVYGEYNSVLCFPTEEMREAFFENFKELIEQCKELL